MRRKVASGLCAVLVLGAAGQLLPEHAEAAPAQQDPVGTLGSTVCGIQGDTAILIFVLSALAVVPVDQLAELTAPLNGVCAPFPPRTTETTCAIDLTVDEALAPVYAELPTKPIPPLVGTIADVLTGLLGTEAAAPITQELECETRALAPQLGVDPNAAPPSLGGELVAPPGSIDLPTTGPDAGGLPVGVSPSVVAPGSIVTPSGATQGARPVLVTRPDPTWLGLVLVGFAALLAVWAARGNQGSSSERGIARFRSVRTSPVPEL